MHQTDLFLIFTDPLESMGIRYMVGGSVASMVYGEPRLTNDIDIIIDLSPAQAGLICSAFPQTQFYCPPEEVIIVESRRLRRGHFNIIDHDTGHKADCYMRGTDPLQDWGLDNRKWIDLSDNRGIWVSPPEYIIVRKLEYFQEGGSQKHIHDISGMLAASAEIIDIDMVNSWITRLHLSAAWQVVRKQAYPDEP